LGQDKRKEKFTFKEAEGQSEDSGSETPREGNNEKKGNAGHKVNGNKKNLGRTHEIEGPKIGAAFIRRL